MKMHMLDEVIRVSKGMLIESLTNKFVAEKRCIVPIKRTVGLIRELTIKFNSFTDVKRQKMSYYIRIDTKSARSAKQKQHKIIWNDVQ